MTSSWEREEGALLQPCNGKSWPRVALWGPRLYSSSRTWTPWTPWSASVGLEQGQASRGPKTSDFPLHVPAALAGLVVVVGHPDVWLRQQIFSDALGPWPGTLCHDPVRAARIPTSFCPLPSPCSFTFMCLCLLFPPHSQCVLTWLQK